MALAALYLPSAGITSMYLRSCSSWALSLFVAQLKGSFINVTHNLFPQLRIETYPTQPEHPCTRPYCPLRTRLSPSLLSYSTQPRRLWVETVLGRAASSLRTLPSFAGCSLPFSCSAEAFDPLGEPGASSFPLLSANSFL